MDITITRKDLVVAASFLTLGLGIGKFGCSSEHPSSSGSAAEPALAGNTLSETPRLPPQPSSAAQMLAQELKGSTYGLATLNRAVLEEQAAALEKNMQRPFPANYLTNAAQGFFAAMRANFTANSTDGVTNQFAYAKDAFDRAAAGALYNRDATNVAFLLSANQDGLTRYQCESASRSFVMGARTTLPDELARKLVYIHLDGHVLPGLALGGGNYLATESTADGAPFTFSTTNLPPQFQAIIVDAGFEDTLRTIEIERHQRGLGVLFCSVPNFGEALQRRLAGPGFSSPFDFGVPHVREGDIARGKSAPAALEDCANAGASGGGADVAAGDDPKEVTLKQKYMAIVLSQFMNPDDVALQKSLQAERGGNVGLLMRMETLRLGELQLSDAELQHVGSYVLDAQQALEPFITTLFNAGTEQERGAARQAGRKVAADQKLTERQKVAFEILKSHGWTNGVMNDPLNFLNGR